MTKKIIGVSGAIGSFSEKAALEYIKKQQIEEFEIKYLISVENVLKSLDEKEIELGVFPIENSNGGIVIEAVYAMSRHIFQIREIFEIPVLHCLLTIPGISKENVKTIASHDQAIKQCRMYIKRNWKEINIQEYEDTAKAAKDLSEGILPKETAIIAPETCAELYRLDVMEKGIQDLKFNFTSFLVVEK
jgi:prephenate dehydratase